MIGSILEVASTLEAASALVMEPRGDPPAACVLRLHRLFAHAKHVISPPEQRLLLGACAKRATLNARYRYGASDACCSLQLTQAAGFIKLGTWEWGEDCDTEYFDTALQTVLALTTKHGLDMPGFSGAVLCCRQLNCLTLHSLLLLRFRAGSRGR